VCVYVACVRECVSAVCAYDAVVYGGWGVDIPSSICAISNQISVEREVFNTTLISYIEIQILSNLCRKSYVCMSKDTPFGLLSLNLPFRNVRSKNRSLTLALAVRKYMCMCSPSRAECHDSPVNGFILFWHDIEVEARDAPHDPLSLIQLLC